MEPEVDDFSGYAFVVREHIGTYSGHLSRDVISDYCRSEIQKVHDICRCEVRDSAGHPTRGVRECQGSQCNGSQTISKLLHISNQCWRLIWRAD
jgi:hypothetical protein